MKMLTKALAGLALSLALAQPCLAQSSTGLFQQSGTGAVARTMQDKARDWLNAKDFGVKCDGSTDDTANINAAITKAGTLAAGTDGIVGVQLPSGVCRIGTSAPVLINASGVWLRGAGNGITTLQSPSGSSYVGGLLKANSLSTNLSNIRISDFTLDANDNTPSGNTTVLFIDHFTTDVEIDHMRVIRIYKDQGTGIGLQGVTRASVHDNFISLTTTSTASVNQCIASTAALQNQYISIKRNICENTGMDLSGLDIWVDSNEVYGYSFGAGIGSETTSGGVLSERHFITNNNVHDSGLGLDGSGVFVDGFQIWAPKSVIANNTAYNNAADGIMCGGQDSVVVGNTVWDNGKSIAEGGILLQSNGTQICSDSIVVGNHSFNTNGASGPQAWALNMSSAVQNVTLGTNNWGIGSTGYVHTSNLAVNNNLQTSGSGPLYADGTGKVLSDDAGWTSYVPTFACGSGTLTSASGQGSYKRIGGKTYAVQIQLSITTNGTCASYISATLPFTQTGKGFQYAGYDYAFGHCLLGHGASSPIQIHTCAIGYPGADGANLNVSGLFEAQ